MRTGWVQPDGARLAAVVVGPDDGEPVLLVAGGPGEARSWRFALPEVDGGPTSSHGLRLVAFDRRGVAGSSHLEPLRSAVDIGDDAINVGRAVLGERFHVVGTSVGGFAALHAAARHPDAVASLTLVATSAGGDTRTPPDQAYLDRMLSPPADPEATARENLALALSPDWPERHPERFAQLVDDIAASPPVSDVADAALVEVFVSHDATAELDRITAPTLVIGCEHDLVIPVANAEVLAAGIAGARLVRLPTGHAVDLEAPEQLVELIAEHVAAHPTR